MTVEDVLVESPGTDRKTKRKLRRENEKWDEIPYLDLFYYLGQKTEWQKECGIMALKVEDSQYECSGCKTREVCMKCAAKSSRREEDLSLAIAPSAPPLSRERLGQEREEVESDTDEEEDEREVTDFDDSPGSQGNIQTPAASNSQARSPNEQRTPIAARIRHGRWNNEGPHMIAPLREAMGPQGGSVLIKVPFSPGDLVIWKQSAGSYRKDPERVARVVKMVIKTQNPDWNDLQVLLDTIMDSTEKEMVLQVTKERAREEIKLRRNREQGYEGTVDELVPSDDPGWNPNSADGYRAIRKYQELLVEGVRTGMPKTLNCSKLYSVWETGTPGKSKAAQPVVIELKEGAKPVRIKQYPIKLEARRGVAPVIAQFVIQGLLKECESEYNTPIFPVRKPNGKYRLVQDLRAINEVVKDIHPVVANPYTLLTSVSEQFEWFTVIDLKDAFFCIPLAIESIKYFAFEWEDPATGRKKQLTWTRLPQGFKNSPTIFGNQLARELEEWKTTQVKEPPTSYTILQYVDDILLATQDRGTCVNLTIALLNMLGQAGYRVSKEKAQLYQAILREQDDVQLQTTSHLNPAEFLRSKVTEDELVHDCVEMTEQVYSSRQDLKDEPLDTADWELFTDGSSFVENGTRTNQAKEVIKTLLKEIIPRFGVPLGLSSDRGPHFIAHIVQETAQMLNITWNLHTPWRPQSSGQVERMNQTLKSQIKKICQEGKIQWPQALPLAVLRIRIKPRERIGVSPYEILYGKPYHASTMKGDPHVIGDQVVYNYVVSLHRILNALRGALQWNRPLSLENPVHDVQPGDQVYVKNWSTDPLRESWSGPHQVILATYTAVKVAGMDSWIHYTRIKKTLTQWVPQAVTPTRLILRANYS
ncbi:hypothetical protein DV515_00014873 [Chloebia gouldiae]|uniref:ribonuclease H n=1 Tax=Chloebia gouldiae TaxID=44316 RepID=A0A3L8RX00_CHLGU|nr:hypothetical protein DV515_00014873 [Chloebia gouldiae]